MSIYIASRVATRNDTAINTSDTHKPISAYIVQRSNSQTNTVIALQHSSPEECHLSVEKDSNLIANYYQLRKNCSEPVGPVSKFVIENV